MVESRAVEPVPGALAKGRIEAFSDGVIAVAITLLVLDLRVPEPDGAATLGDELVALWPNYVAYVISFVAIGIMWINHHTMLRRLACVDHSILVLNLLLLLCIVALPFTTSVMATYLDAPRDRHVAAVVYAGSFLVTSTMFVTIQCHILVRRPHLLAAPQDRSERRKILARAAIAPPGYVLATAVGFVTPYLTLSVCALLGGIYLVAPPLVGDSKSGPSATA